jgi:nucleoid-associated protein YgaU
MGTATITEWDIDAGRPVPDGVDLTVDFDPKSLQLAYSPTGTAGATATSGSVTESKAPTQQTGQSATLSLELVFDTTATGTSVQARTDPLVLLTQPGRTPNSRVEVARARRVVLISWGTFLFTGAVQSLSQVMDFFSDTGVPLRATVQLSLVQVSPPNPDATRPPTALGPSFGASAGIGAGPTGRAGTTPLTLSQAGDSVQAIAARAGGGVSWKVIAAANGIDNPRLLPPGTVLDPTARPN